MRLIERLVAVYTEFISFLGKLAVQCKPQFSVKNSRGKSKKMPAVILSLPVISVTASPIWGFLKSNLESLERHTYSRLDNPRIRHLRS